MNLLQEAFAAHQSGRLQDAQRLYREFIRANPGHAEAHHLLGVACMQMGDLLGAIESLTQATRLNDKNPNYFNNLGLAQFYRNDPASARANYQRALALAPKNADTLNNLGMAQQRLDDLDGAIASFKTALQITPDEPEILHNYGIALRDGGQHAAAMAALKKAIDVSGGIPDTHAALASLQFLFDQYDDALESCWAAVKLDPLHIDAHKTFKGLMNAMNREDERYDTFRWALDAMPQNPKVYEQYGWELAQDEQFAEAEPILRRALEIDPDQAIALTCLGWSLSMQGQHDEALTHHARAGELEPDNPQILESHGQSLIRAGRAADAVTVLMKAHRIVPRMSSVIGTMTIAMVEAEDPAVDDFVDYDTDVVTQVLPTPPGFSDIKAFNDTLHTELEKHHQKGSLPLDQTMRGGTQIPNNLFKNASGNVLIVRNLILDAIRAYVDGLQDDPEHPFLRYINRDFQFTGAWSTILYGAGYDASHVHNEGWLSGVYYVKTPDLDEARWASGEGCIQFGAPPDTFVSDRNRTRRLIRPQPGLLVLFPSYVWHGVKPFTQEGLRHSIAFDIR
ncbi:tetratricopeptide repeat protein [bacterium SCSIO 12827]|nr:tetratricopeptide repeat protein [bacterium SCSIO 12827]